MPNFTFSRVKRLTHAKEFQTVFARKKSAADEVLIVYGCENELDHPRLGLTVSRKLGNAVARNKIKRLCREAFRLMQHDLPALDLVVLPRKQNEPTLDEVQESLRALAAHVAKKLTKGKR